MNSSTFSRDGADSPCRFRLFQSAQPVGPRPLPPLVALISIWTCLGCVTHVGNPVGANTDLGTGKAYFVAGAVKYSVSDKPVLDDGDAILFAAGLRGIGFEQRALDRLISAGETLDYLEDPDLEILYLTGHGSAKGLVFNDVVITPKGLEIVRAGGEEGTNVTDRPLLIKARYVILANCQAGRPDWSEAFSENTQALFGYMDNIFDELDNQVAVDYVRCLEEEKTVGQLWTTDDHHYCWVQANRRQRGTTLGNRTDPETGAKIGELLAQRWVSLVRRNQTEVWRIDATGREELVRDDVPRPQSRAGIRERAW